MDVLDENKIVQSTGEKYGALYYFAEDMEKNYDTFLDDK